MMKNETVLKFINRCNECADKKMTRNAYAMAYNLSSAYFTNTWNNILNNLNNNSIDINLYNQAAEALTKLDSAYAVYTVNGQYDDEGQDEYTTYERDESGKIQTYAFKFFRKGKNPVIGKLTRDDMEVICKLYTNFGQNVQRREVSRYFPNWSLNDFKKILAIFNITKDSCPLPPHVIEENSQEECLAIQARNKENAFMIKVEQRRIKDTENLLNKVQTENVELKAKLDNLVGMNFKIENFPKIAPFNVKASDNNLILYIADVHIGAKVCFGTLYDENKNYGVNEINRRLDTIINRVKSLGHFNTINICLMGDMMDCCGPTNKTSRLDHSLPENMDGYEQVNAYLSIMTRFVNNLISCETCNNLRLYSVRDGNHTGPFEYIATKALFSELSKNSNIQTQLFDDFFGIFKCNGHKFVISHGKDASFCKKGLPLNLDDKTKIKMYEWFESKNINGKNIHVVKADLHSESTNSCDKFDYRNVISLFGASDYSSYNFSRNEFGCSYDMFIGDNLVRGQFKIN